MRGRWRLAAGLALFFVAGFILLFRWGGDSGPKLSQDARRFRADARKTFVSQVRAAGDQKELSDVDDVDLVNRGADFCVQLEKTGSSLKAVFELQLAGRTYPGDVYVTATARRILCPNLPDSDSRPSGG